MINPKMEEALNKQINEELYSQYLYMAMMAYFEDQKLPGFAAWMNAQQLEENFHAMKFFQYIVSKGGRVKLLSINEPDFDWDNPVKAFEAALSHEEHITACINDLVKLAREIGDVGTEVFLHWYVTEQVEEEENVQSILDKLSMVDTAKSGLYLLDKELGNRVFTSPASAGE